MGRCIALSIAVLFLISAIPSALSAQQKTVKAAIVMAAEGEVFLDGSPLQLAKYTIHLFRPPQTLSTKQGRLQLILAPYTNLSLGQNAILRIEQSNPNGAGLTLEKGSLLIEVVRKMTDPVGVKISNSTVTISKRGLYRLDFSPGGLRVYAGKALADSGSEEAQVKKEREIRFGSDLRPSRFDPKASDALHQWSAQKSLDIFLVDLETDNWKWKGPKPSVQNPSPVGFFENSSYRVRLKAQMPPQHVQPYRAEQGIDWGRIAHDAEDRIRREEDFQRAQQLEELLKRMEEEPPQP